MNGTQINEAVLDALNTLTPSEKEKVLEYTRSLADASAEAHPKTKRPSLKGALSHLKFELSDEEFREFRREMWKNFPREVEP